MRIFALESGEYWIWVLNVDEFGVERDFELRLGENTVYLNADLIVQITDLPGDNSFLKLNDGEHYRLRRAALERLTKFLKSK